MEKPKDVYELRRSTMERDVVVTYSDGRVCTETFTVYVSLVLKNRVPIRHW